VIDPVRLFNQFVRDARPLSQYLSSRVRPLQDGIDAVATTEELKEFVGSRLPGLLAAVKSEPPRLGGTRSARRSHPDWMTTSDNRRIRATGYFFATEVGGDVDALSYWPNERPELPKADDLPSATASLVFDNGDDAWSIGRDPDGNRSLYTTIYLTLAEETEHIDIATMFKARRDRVEPIIGAIAEQITEFNADLDDRVREAIDQKRTELTNRESVTASLTFPYEWLPKHPTLEVSGPVDAEPDESSTKAEAPSATADPIKGDPAEYFSATDRHAPVRYRLSASSFEEVLAIIRIWTNSVERYQRSFGALNEDQISDLLAATLNATTPGASREVYTNSGKSDIYVRADVLAEGSGNEKVLIIESKWASTEKIIKEALDPQLFGYLAAYDTAAVLLLLVGQHDAVKRRNDALSALRTVDGFQREEPSKVDGWPLFLYERDGRVVRVCVATVHIDRTSVAEDIGVVEPN